jgi:hypothetical protein
VRPQTVDRHVRGANLPQQRQRDRPVRLHDQLTADVVLRAVGRPTGVGGQRLDSNLVADLQLVGRAGHLAGEAKHERDAIVDADAIFRNVSRTGVPDILTLSKSLPIDLPARLPGNLALAAGRGAVDAPYRVWRGGAEGLAELDLAGLDDLFRW